MILHENGQKQCGFLNNFGAIRYILALVVLVCHFNVLIGTDIPLPFSAYFSVSGFFILSGFLIYNSFMSSENVTAYINKRFSRIFPSYIFIIVLCAFLLVYVSELPPLEYFTSPEWWKYLLMNLLTLNFVQPSLPGVFESSSISAVNGSLCTIKVELTLYLTAIPVFLLYRKTKIDFWKIFVVILLFSGAYKLYMDYMSERTGNDIYSILSRQFCGQMSFFYTGVLFSIYIDRILKYKYYILLASAFILFVATFIFGDAQLYQLFIKPLVISGVIISLAFIGTWGRWADLFENCSYEIYLFYFPIIQLAKYYRLDQSLGTTETLILVITVVIIVSSIVAKYISLPIRKYLRRTPSTVSAI